MLIKRNLSVVNKSSFHYKGHLLSSKIQFAYILEREKDVECVMCCLLGPETPIIWHIDILQFKYNIR